ncbi:hypothetical protein [Acinetobacter bouvetii]|uniref:Restriction endonuclease n=1 Tax=Acinetobacter bouvetii TaxID=202951 RepID=A0A811GA92_9GAMM|nr:hypothetical protein [Acinetobacter bouvetii]CAB1210557.1 hypothetical protein SFB21_0835 [Acinetobacter bouvetii]
MNIDNLIREIFKKNGSISKVDVNVLIKSILQCYFDKEKIAYELDTGSSIKYYDFILSSDFRSFSNPIGIKVDVDLRSIFTAHFENQQIDNNEHNQFEKLRSTLYELISTYTISSIILITFLDEDQIKEFKEKNRDLNKNFNIEVIGKDFINEILQDMPNQVEEIISKLFSS